MTNEPQPLSDEALAREAQSGSLSAFEELVYRYEGRIFRFAASNCRNDFDAREITQDVFVTAFRKLEQFDPRRSFVTWLFTIARRKCIDRHRANRRCDSEPLPEIAHNNTPAELLARRENAQDLWNRARNTLNDAQFLAIWLHYAEDMAVADISRVMGRTETYVKVILFRARIALARELKKPRNESVSALLNRVSRPLARKLSGLARTAMF